MHHTTVNGWSWRRFRVRWIITHAEYWSGISWAEWEDLSEPTSLRQQRATRAELNFLYRDLVNDEDSFLVFRLDNSTRPNSMEIFFWWSHNKLSRAGMERGTCARRNFLLNFIFFDTLKSLLVHAHSLYIFFVIVKLKSDFFVSTKYEFLILYFFSLFYGEHYFVFSAQSIRKQIGGR